MKKIIRIIPRLDIKNGFLIKGINLEGLRVLGNPIDFAKNYYDQGADEISYLDNVATLYGTQNLSKFIKKTAKNIFIPLSVGGGISKLDDIKELLDTGADKICINSAVVKNLQFLEKAVKLVGSANIVINIEYVNIDKDYFVTTSLGRDLSNIKLKNWAKIVENTGAGEIVLTSINHEGIGNGFDIKNIKKISQAVNIPVIAHGGAGNFDHVYEVIKKTKVSGVMIASLFHYDLAGYFKFKSPKTGNISFLQNKIKKNPKFELSKLKKFLKKRKISIR